jgi:hypothetical protein
VRAGSALVEISAQITDRKSGGAVSATAQSYAVRASVPCATTVSTTIGSACSVTTSVVAVMGGNSAIGEQKLAIWQLSGDVKVYDGGADGAASTTADNTLFAVGGVFLP